MGLRLHLVCVDGTHSLVEHMAGRPHKRPHWPCIAQPQLLVVGVHHAHLHCAKGQSKAG